MSVGKEERVRILNSVDGDNLMEKDKTEVELEKLLFGDDAGFYKSLQPHGQGSAPLTAPAGQSQHVEQDRLDQKGLEDIDDADVCTFGWFF